MKTTAHKVISDITIRTCIDMLGDGFRSPLERNRPTLVQATYDEDQWYKNHERITNWHFSPHPENNSQDSFRFGLRFHLYSRDVYKGHIDDFQNALSELADRPRSKRREKDVFYQIGALLHHIQDMCTPSHITPIFHGPIAPPPFKTADDAMELFTEQNIHATLRDFREEVGLHDRPENRSEEDSFLQIYQDAAEDTRKFLKDTKIQLHPYTLKKDDTVALDKPKEFSTGIFWKEYDFDNNPEEGKATAGFGTYGPLEQYFGNGFGKTDTDAYCEVKLDEQDYRLYWKDYQKLYLELIKLMVLNTIRGLQLADRQFRGKVKPC